MTMSNITTIHERTASLPKQGGEDVPVVSNVKVLGIESKNGRKYPLEVMRNALSKYENAIVNIDHPAGSEPRSYEDRFGRLTNARLESDGIYADLAYNPKHPLAEGFSWWVKNDPKAIGLSHHAQARTKMTPEGVEEIEEIVKVDSVDLVAEPATTAGLLEAVMNVVKNKPVEVVAMSKVNRADDGKFASAGGQVSKKRHKTADIEKDKIRLADKKTDESKFGPTPPPGMKVQMTSNFSKWKAMVKAAGATKIDGDKDIATALNSQGKGVGEWDGEKGEVYTMKAKEAAGNPIAGLNKAAGMLKSGLTDMVKNSYEIINLANAANLAVSKAGPKSPDGFRAKIKNFYNNIEVSFPDERVLRKCLTEVNGLISYLSSVGDIGESTSPEVKESPLLNDYYKDQNARFDARVKALVKKGWKQVKPNIFAWGGRGHTTKSIMNASDIYWDKIKDSGDSLDSITNKKENDDMNMDNENASYEGSLRDNIGDIVMDDTLDAEAKIAKLLALVGETESVDGGEDKPMDEAENMDFAMDDEDDDDKKEMSHMQTEESIRRRKDPALTKLMEEVDAYRARDRRDRLIGEARKLCESSSLPNYAITESFLGILSETGKKNWKNLIEDRRRVIFRGEQPVSAVGSNGELTVDSLVRALRS